MADRPAPSATAILIGTAILSLITGYMLGTASSLNLLPSPFAPSKAPRTRSRNDTTGYDDESESSEEELDAEFVLDHAPNWANGPEADRRDGLKASKPETKAQEVVDDNEECKLVLVVRTDLGMTKGMWILSVRWSEVPLWKPRGPRLPHTIQTR